MDLIGLGPGKWTDVELWCSSVIRVSVFGRRTFAALRLIYC